MWHANVYSVTVSTILVTMFLRLVFLMMFLVATSCAFFGGQNNFLSLYSLFGGGEDFGERFRYGRGGMRGGMGYRMAMGRFGGFKNEFIYDA